MNAPCCPPVPEVAIDRVVVVNDDSVASGGAAQIALASIARLRARGLPVTLITGDDGANAELVRMGVEVVALESRHILEGSRTGAALRGLYDARARDLLAAWIAANDTPSTVYHLHNWHKFLSPAIFAPLRQVAPRLLISTHDFFLACPNGGYYDFPRNKACDLVPLGFACLTRQCDKRHPVHKVWRTARHLLRRSLFSFGDSAATVLAVHDGMVPYLQKGGIPGHSIRVLRNPVVAWRKERIKAETNREVLFVGRLEADKGIDLLCAACRRLGVKLRVAGDGPLRAELTARYPEVAWLGRLGRAEIGAAAAVSRMLVVPTRGRETFGLVAFEALACGLPVVLSAHALIAGELEREGIGLLCDTDRPDDLIAPMRRLLADDSFAECMSRTAYARAPVLIHGPEQWGERLIGLYREKLQTALQPQR